MFDLHLHSLYSDGNLTIEEIIDLLQKLKIKGFSITDHDTTNGILEAIKFSNNSNINFIPGIEFGITINSREVHILGYYIDIDNNDIVNLVSEAKNLRRIRTKKILSKLKDLDIYIEDEEISKYSKKDIISRSHIARILVDKNITTSIKESFDEYLGNKGLAFVKKESLKSIDIINTIKKSGGVAVLAHPACINDDNIVLNIIHEGIDGLEIVNSKHDLDDIRKYYSMAIDYKLIQTCGSDCHGKIINSSMYIGKFNMNKKNINRMNALHNLRVI